MAWMKQHGGSLRGPDATMENKTSSIARASVLSPQPYNLTILPDDEQQKPRLLFEPETKYHKYIFVL
jgi:hypothetical protein